MREQTARKGRTCPHALAIWPGCAFDLHERQCGPVDGAIDEASRQHLSLYLPYSSRKILQNREIRAWLMFCGSPNFLHVLRRILNPPVANPVASDPPSVSEDNKRAALAALLSLPGL